MTLTEPGKLVFLEKDEPTADHSHWVPVEVASCGVCGSDIPRAFHGKAYFTPLVMGHEFSAVVREDKSGFKKGEKVTAFPLLPCKKCDACQIGEFAQCSNYNYYGSRRDGAFQEVLWIPPENLLRIPEHVNLHHAAFTEPAAVALHGVRKFALKGGERAVVFGAGPIGNMCAQWLKILGVQSIAIVDLDEEKLSLAENMGFIPLNPKKGDIIGQIKNTFGALADISVEAVGIPLTFRQSLMSVGLFGQVLFLGNLLGILEIADKDFTHILRQELRIYGTWNSKVTPGHTSDWHVVLQHLDKELKVSELISHKPGLEDGASIMNAINDRNGQFNKVLFHLNH